MTRRHEVVLWFAMGFDTVFFALLVPLLPEYVQRANLSQLAAGVLTGAFAAGTLLGAMPGAIIAARRGARSAVVIGLLSAALSCAAFGLATSAAALCAARLLQGMSSGVIWTAALTWLVAAAPPERRAETIGRALAAAVVGQLVGPVLGALGAAHGTTTLFVAIAACGCVVALVVWRVPDRGYTTDAEPPFRRFPAALRQQRMLGAVWLLSLPALLGGTLAVIAPLKLSALGLGAAAIAAIWLLAAALEAALAPVIGRWSDRRGHVSSLRVALTMSLGCSLVLPWIDERWALAALVAAAALSYAALWVPSMTNISDLAQGFGLSQAGAFALQSLWAPAHVVGSVVVGGLIAQLVGDAAVFLILAAICAVTLGTLRPDRGAWQRGLLGSTRRASRRPP